MSGDPLDLDAITDDAERAHEAGECHLSEWSCSHCEAAAERMAS